MGRPGLVSETRERGPLPRAVPGQEAETEKPSPLCKAQGKIRNQNFCKRRDKVCCRGVDASFPTTT